jgi:ATP:ADP antiporter, AAA family
MGFPGLVKLVQARRSGPGAIARPFTRTSYCDWIAIAATFLAQRRPPIALRPLIGLALTLEGKTDLSDSSEFIEWFDVRKIDRLDLMNANSHVSRSMSWLAFAWFFCILSGYYVIRPIRDTMGVASGRDSLNWLFLATFVAMLVAVPLYSACVAKLSRRRVVGLVYRFFIANLLLFWWLLQIETADIRIWVSRAFFVWAGVFSLYVTSVFWSVLTDLFDSGEAKQSFGFIAAGGTTGAIAGSITASTLAEHLSTHHLLLVPVSTLEIGLWFAAMLQRQVVQHKTIEVALVSQTSEAEVTGEATGGGLFDGVKGVLKSRYLLAVCGSLFLGQLCGTHLYMQQASIVGAALESESARTALFSNMNLATQLLTLALQASIAGWLTHRAGLAIALAITPLAYAVTFATLGIAPSLAVFAVGDVIRRGLTYGVLVPAREVLFTVVSREDKYKSKGFIDTVVLRGGDAVSSQILAGARLLTASSSVIQMAMLPVALVWIGVSVRLAYWQKSLANTGADGEV